MQPNFQPEATRDCFRGWRKYPGLEDGSDQDRLLDSSLYLSRQLSQLGERLFSSREIDVGLITLRKTHDGEYCGPSNCQFRFLTMRLRRHSTRN